jgi:hypothetical protein
MTAIASAARPHFDIGRVAKLTFGAIGRNWLVFGLISLIFGAIPYGVLQWLQLSQIEPNAVANPAANIWLSLLSLFVNLFGSCLIQAALVHGTIVHLNGRRANFGDCLSTGLRFMLPVLAIGFLLGLGVALGLILLIVPGIMMGLAWLVAVPVEVVERTGVFAAFSRSADLTRNHRWAILGLVVVYWVVVWIISATIGAVTIGASVGASLGAGGAVGGMSAMRVGMAIFMAAYQAVISMLGATGVASVYYELRSIKEGVGPEALASVFD